VPHTIHINGSCECGFFCFQRASRGEQRGAPPSLAPPQALIRVHGGRGGGRGEGTGLNGFISAGRCVSERAPPPSTPSAAFTASLPRKAAAGGAGIPGSDDHWQGRGRRGRAFCWTLCLCLSCCCCGCGCECE
jgi:hypothetical protein